MASEVAQPGRTAVLRVALWSEFTSLHCGQNPRVWIPLTAAALSGSTPTLWAPALMPQLVQITLHPRKVPQCEGQCIFKDLIFKLYMPCNERAWVWYVSIHTHDQSRKSTQLGVRLELTSWQPVRQAGAPPPRRRVGWVLSEQPTSQAGPEAFRQRLLFTLLKMRNLADPELQDLRNHPDSL